MHVERPYRANREPIHLELPPHEFVDSEFEQGKGYCDKCGGGPGAEIHHPLKRIEPIVRIAEALERLAHQAEVEHEARLARSRMSFVERLWLLVTLQWWTL
jgi:hypothetical protein